MASNSDGPGLLIAQADCPPDQEAAFKQRYEARLRQHVAAGLVGEIAWHTVKMGGLRLLALGHAASAAALLAADPPLPRAALEPAAEAGARSGAAPASACCVGRLFSDSHPELEGQPSPPYSYLVFFHTPDEHWAEFDAWYVEEHLPMLLAIPGWRRARRYRLTTLDGPSWHHVTLHEVAELAAFSSPELERARNTPWRLALARHAWNRSSREVYRRQDRPR